MAETILQVDHLSYTYQKNSNRSKKAVDDVSLTIQKGEIFGLVGESGCGKTTTGKLIVNLLQPDKGKIQFEGHSFFERGPKAREHFHQDVQMIFQDPYASLNPRMKVKDIIAEGMRIHHLYDSGKQLKARIDELIQLVGLSSYHETRYPHEFSGGQRQRIGIARALAVDPKLIVCDEPISALDVSIQAQIINLLKKLQEQQGLTYVFISHDLGMVHYISDRIGVMLDGRIVEYGLADDIFFHPEHPYTKKLLGAIPQITQKKQKIIITDYVPSDHQGDFRYQELTNGHFVLVSSTGKYW